MTPAELQTLLETNDAEGCIALFAGATEAERCKVASVAAARLRAVTAGVPARHIALLPAMPEDYLKRFATDVAVLRDGLRPAQIAVLATASCGALRKFGERALPPLDDAFAVLADRRPPWLGEWAEAALSWGGTEWWRSRMADRWRLVRRLVRAGLCERPRSARYINAMPFALSTEILRELRDDPGLLDDEVWRVFETEPERGVYSGLSADLFAALATLAEEGRIPRPRLLEASLEALSRDFPDQYARCFVQFYETLRPTAGEQAERVDRYLGLTASRNPSTVTFALKVLSALEEAGRLDPEKIVAAAGPVLLARAKGTVLSALGMLDRAAGREPGVRARAANVALGALTHESPAVHEAVIDMIERHGDHADGALVQELRARIETIAPSQRPRALAWLGAAGGAPETEPAPSDISLDEVLARARSLDPVIARKAGVTAVVELIGRDDGEVEAIDFDDADAPRLIPENAVAPITELDELIAVFAQVLEDASDAVEVERVLDGVSRLCDRVPDDFEDRTGPLRVRAGRRDAFGYCGILNGLALAWTTGKPHPVNGAYSSGYLDGFFARRVFALACRTVDRQAAPLVGAPTHVGGWIDPRVLVERARAGAALSGKVDRLDASLALLRLAPDPGPRAEALKAAATLEGPFASALRYALGGQGETVGPDAGLWVAAARARAPREDDPLVEARHAGLGPDAGRAARHALLPGPHRPRDRYSGRRRSVISCEPPVPTGHVASSTRLWDLPSSSSSDYFSVMLHDALAHGGRFGTGWVASAWPLGRESFFAVGCDMLLGTDYPPSEIGGVRPFVEALLDPDTPLRPMGRLLLAGMLSSNRPELQGLAVDALVAAVDDGRIDGRLLGESVRQLLDAGLAKPARLAKAFADAARVSLLHARVVAQAIQRLAVGQSHPPLGFHLLLELLRELLVETGGWVDDPANRAGLEGLLTGGKTARLVRDILAIEAANARSTRAAALVRALWSRVERGERWVANRGGSGSSGRL